MRFLPGQRWLSSAEPELGLGTVLRSDSRQVQILFAAAGVMRVYSTESAPLLRAEFRVGDIIRANGDAFAVESVTERDGILHYTGKNHRLPEGALDDVQNISRANDRLISGRIDRSDYFDLRLEALERRAQAKSNPGFGILAARIDLISHQLRVAQIASERRPPRILFADEVGLGKTIEACLVVARLIAQGRANRILIVVPEALVYQWFVELLRRFNLSFAIYDEERMESIELEGDGRNPFLDDQWVLTDLVFLTSTPERTHQALNADWDLLVVDEAHHLQWSPQQTSPEYALVEQLAKKTPSVLLLTATPEQLGRSGHFARLRLLDPARFHSLEAYQEESSHYVELSSIAEHLSEGVVLDKDEQAIIKRHLSNQQDELTLSLLNKEDEASRHALLRSLIDRHGTGRVMFRNRRAIVGGFPKRVAHIHTLPYKEPSDPFCEQLREEFLGDIASPPFSPAHQYNDDPRLAWLVALLEQNPNHKFLLICRTQAKLHALDEALRLRSGVSISRFHEGLGIIQRDRAAAHFADITGARLMLCTEIGSEGRNFQFAQHLVLWDLPLDPDLLEQRIGRLDRIGQSGEVNLHLCVQEGSAQHALLRWYHEGLNAFSVSPEDGRELLKRYGDGLVSAALAMSRGEPDAHELLESLIAETQAAHIQLADTIARGRDRLLELGTTFAHDAETLKQSLIDADTDQSSDDFILKLFELYGVGIDDLGPRTVLLDPEMLTTEAFPGLEEPRQATFDRRTALSREDMLFLRLDHPMVTGSIDLLLSSETGNAGFMVDDTLPARNGVLEAIFVLECIAPNALGVDRFLPPTPIRIAIDTRLIHRNNWHADERSRIKAIERDLDVARYRKIFATLIPPMLAKANELVSQIAQTKIKKALADASHQVGAEIERLVALAAVNTGVRPNEIAAAKDELDMLLELLPTAVPRLDALRLVVSHDFLKLRA